MQKLNLFHMWWSLHHWWINLYCVKRCNRHVGASDLGLSGWRCRRGCGCRCCPRRTWCRRRSGWSLQDDWAKEERFRTSQRNLQQQKKKTSSRRAADAKPRPGPSSSSSSSSELEEEKTRLSDSDGVYIPQTLPSAQLLQLLTSPNMTFPLRDSHMICQQ